MPIKKLHLVYQAGFLLLAILLHSAPAPALVAPETGPLLEVVNREPTDEQLHEYYFIPEHQDFTPAEATPESTSPFQILSLVDSSFHSNFLSLLAWQLARRLWPDPDEPYNRRRHFGTWLRDHEDATCLNTRGKLLERESMVPVKYRPNGCTVESGKWYEPYSGTIQTQASVLQIDHVVPLKNAYISGAWKWDDNTRCGYANFMANKFHLVISDARENMRKGDRTPAGYMPPNEEYACEYIKNWLQVKLIWGLILNPEEAAAIDSLVEQNHCNKRSFRMTPAALNQQRAAMEEFKAICAQ